LSGLDGTLDEDEGVVDGEDVAPEAAAGAGVSLEVAAGVGDGSADDGVVGAGAGLELGTAAGAVVEVFGIPEADFGSAEGWFWANTIPAALIDNAKVRIFR